MINNTNNNGFSLIELSIVLIIIGLLVAGITGGASLIKSAELRSVMSDIRNYQTAVNAYYTSTGELPGTNGSSEMNFQNSAYAWTQMAEEGIIDVDLGVTTAPTGSTVLTIDADNAIPSKVKGGYYALGYNNEMLANVIFLVGIGETSEKMTAAIAGGTTEAMLASPASKKDAQFLDDKMDNGISDSGKIYSFTGPTSIPSDTTGCVYSTTADTVSETNKVCSVAVSIGL